ncbi:hypothetical protein GE253_23020 [Niveispirillum sp. SYP-B3756]|uniref:DotH/IcmK family type IV secretion protein n=1 Tax=Niveispirillum sp. SYP-B3756 TaxID=2662178 RepID=UPI001292A6C2|nr:DotH/IcmK family type IV secretion protein [Niveispirillum sp. SYP-B3756]MQP68194.1 hypothetical protein [Niveispirillum sp. SYP-B3756]
MSIVRSLVAMTAMVQLVAVAAAGGAEQRPTPPTEAEIIRSLVDEAIRDTRLGSTPLDRSQIRELKRRALDDQDAADAPVGKAPTLRERQINANLSGANLSKNETIETQPGTTTVLTILDATGQPWPAVRATAGDGDTYQVTIVEGAEHIVEITQRRRVQTVHPGNLNLILKGLPSPLTFIIRPGTEYTDSNLAIRLPEFGPNAELPTAANIVSLSPGDPTIAAVLDGAMPPGAVPLRVSGASGLSAWQAGSRLFLRSTRASLVLYSPAWSETQVAIGGKVRAYAIDGAPTALVLSDQGQIVTVRLTPIEQGVR